MKSLSKRLDKIASYVDKGSFIADIGSDHCLLPIFLLSKGVISKAQAVDNKPGPYERMTKAIENSGYKGQISPSLSNGIENLDPDANVLILAGMGGFLISDILKAHPENLKNINTIIVDAHTDISAVYETLSSLSFELKDSCFLIDKEKPYDVMKWERVEEPVSYSYMEMKYGAFNIKHPNDELKAYYRHYLEVLNRIKAKVQNDSKKQSEIDEEIKEISSILN